MSRFMVLVVVVVLGCGKPPERVEPVKPRVFEADAVGDGAALIARAEVNNGEVAVTVIARKLGPVLGYAFRLQADGLTPRGDLTVEEALGPNAFGEALYFGRSLSAGAARQGAAAGEKTIDAETVLARATFTLGSAPVTLKLTDTSVRRANGDGVVVVLGGGHIGGAP